MVATANEWSEALLAFDQLLIEGLVVKALRSAAQASGRTVEKEWGSIKLLEACLVGRGIGHEEAKEVVSPLREAHEHRTIVKGHSAPGRKQDLAKEALRSQGGFRAHFEDLVARCDSALGRAMETMGIRLNS